MKKNIIALSTLTFSILSFSSNVSAIPKAPVVKAPVVKAPKIRIKSGRYRKQSYNANLSFEVSRVDLESSFSIDSSNESPLYGSPTSLLEYNSESVKYFHINYGWKKGRSSFELKSKYLINYSNGSNQDYDWHSQEYTDLFYPGTTNMFSGTESEISDIKGWGLSINNDYLIEKSGNLSYYYTQSLSIDSSSYTANGAELLHKGHDYYNGYEVGDTIILNSEKTLGYEEYFLSYDFGLKINYQIGKNINSYISGTYIPMGVYYGEDTHYVREDLKKNPSQTMGSYKVTGFGGETGLEYTLPRRKNEPQISLFAKAFYKEMTADYTKDAVRFRFEDDTNVTVNLYEADKKTSGISIGFKYIY